MLSSRVKYAILVLAELEDAGRNGLRLTVSEIKERCGINPRSGFDSRGISMAMCTLRRKRWVENSNSRHYIVADLTRATLYDLVMAVDETLCMGHRVDVESWPSGNRDKYTAVMELDENLRSDMERRLKRVLLTDLFACHQSTEHKLRAGVRRRAAAARIVDGNVMFENRY